MLDVSEYAQVALRLLTHTIDDASPIAGETIVLPAPAGQFKPGFSIEAPRQRGLRSAGMTGLAQLYETLFGETFEKAFSKQEPA